MRPIKKGTSFLLLLLVVSMVTIPGYMGLSRQQVQAAIPVFHLDPQTAVDPPVIPAEVGDLLSRMSVSIHFTDDNAGLDAAKAAGFTYVRRDLSWSMVETRRGVYDWTSFDQLVSAASSRGMKVLFILDYGNALYTGTHATPPTTEKQLTAFGNYAEAAAAHFAGKGVRYEIWNEPDSAKFWPPAPDSQAYANLCKEAIRRVHLGDPGALIATGGPVTYDSIWLDKILAKGAGAGANAIGAHSYHLKNAPLTGASNLIQSLANYKAVIAQYLYPPPPVWDTEGGYSSTDYDPYRNGHSTAGRNRQALLLARKLLTSRAADLAFYNVYDLIDDGSDPENREHNFGLLTESKMEKQAMTAVKKIKEVADSRVFKGSKLLQANGLHYMLFDGGKDKVFAVWTTTSGLFKITVPSGTVATDYLGGPVTLVPDEGGRVSVTIDESNVGPVYFKFYN